MISRKTTMSLAVIFQELFGDFRQYGNFTDELYDFLYEREYETYFCNLAKEIRGGPRDIQEFIQQIHTGEFLAKSTPNWSLEQRKKLGQRYLFDLARDLLNSWGELTQIKRNRYTNKLDTYDVLVRNLELDGYQYTRENGRLLFLETGVLDEDEESGLLEHMYRELELGDVDVTLHHLKLSAENYISEHWGDVISNARSFLEHTLREIYVSHLMNKTGSEPNLNIYTNARAVRDYLEREELLETKEAKAIGSIYGLLSDTGSHPYIAEKDQARLIRHLALTFTQFVMLRYQGYLRSKDWAK